MKHATLARDDARIPGGGQPRTTVDAEPVAAHTGAQSHDRSGFAVFSDGDRGAMHVFAHAAFDNGDIASGHRGLGAWLDANTGNGSDWIHLQFHMAVFELALGDWDSGYSRFMREILPAALETPLALTDAPGLLWRLAIAAPAGRALPWQALYPMAARTISREADPFTTLHQLLVFAGAGAGGDIMDWRRAQRASASSVSRHVLDRAAHALACIARCDYAAAARGLHEIAPKLPLIGGSFAQNDLFRQLEQWCLQQSTDAGALQSAGLAA